MEGPIPWAHYVGGTCISYVFGSKDTHKMSFITDSKLLSANGMQVNDKGFNLTVVGILCEECSIHR